MDVDNELVRTVMMTSITLSERQMPAALTSSAGRLDFRAHQTETGMGMVGKGWGRVKGRLAPMILHALGKVLMGTGQALLLFAPGLVRWLLGEGL